MLYTRVSELAFKRRFRLPAPREGRSRAAFFIPSRSGMSIFVYADESGVFDREHNDVFVFGGLIFLGREHPLVI